MSARLAYAPAEPQTEATQSRQHFCHSDSEAGRFSFAGPADVHAFGPAEFVKTVHPFLSHRRFRSNVVFGIRHGDDWTQRKAAGDEAIQIAQELVAGSGISDVYLSMNAFRGGRRLENLAALGCCFADVDYHNIESLKSSPPSSVLQMLLGALVDDRIPLPSFAVDSGRGLYLIWLHDRLPAKALKRWNLVQVRIQTCLASFGADTMAKDAARVLRLPGSINMKALTDRRRVGLLWYQGQPDSPYRYVFDAFADEVLPHTRFEIRSILAERAKRNAAGTAKPRKQARRRDGGSYGEAVLSDLERLRVFRHSNGFLPAGARDKWLFVAAMALSWMCPPDAVEAEIVSVASRAAGWSESETRNRMTSVLSRARNAAAGRTITFNGKEIDPRYIMKAASIVDWLGITPDEQSAAGLRVLVGDSFKKARKVVEERQRRRDKGAKSRTEVQAARLALGRRAHWMHVRDGLSYNEIAMELAVSKGQVMKAVREAREAA